MLFSLQDRKEQRSSFRDILRGVEEGDPPSEKVSDQSEHRTRPIDLSEISIRAMICRWSLARRCYIWTAGTRSSSMTGFVRWVQIKGKETRNNQRSMSDESGKLCFPITTVIISRKCTLAKYFSRRNVFLICSLPTSLPYSLYFQHQLWHNKIDSLRMLINF